MSWNVRGPSNLYQFSSQPPSDLARPADSDEARLRDFIIIATRPGFGTHFRLRTTSRPGCCSGVFATMFPDEDTAWATAAGGVRCNVAVGSIAAEPVNVRADLCPLLLQ